MSSGPNGHPRELLSDYLDDELGLEARASVDRHLAGCEDCRVELEALRRLARAFADLSVPPVPLDLEARIGRGLDAASVARRRRWRFAVPATIAATIGAIGLLVALQWREGGVRVPSAPEPQPPPRVFDEAKPSYAPAPRIVPEQLPAPPREKEAKRNDALEKDVMAEPAPNLKREAESATAGVPGGIIGGAVGGIASGVEGAVERRTAAKAANEAARQMQPAAPPPARSDTGSVCADQWSDSGLRATWEVQDVGTAVRELNQMARDVGGVGVWRGVVDGRPYVLVVPRDRFEEVFFALRARGVTGLREPPALAEGKDCASISVGLTVTTSSTSPPR